MLKRFERFETTAYCALMALLVLFYANEIWKSSGILPERPLQTANQHSDMSTDHKEPPYNVLDAFWRWTSHDPVAFYTAVLALFTGTLVVVSSIQIKFLIKADETARITANAARASAESAKLADRAHIFAGPGKFWPEDVEITMMDSAGGKLETRRTLSQKTGVKVTLNNFGRTPGFPMEIYGAFGIEGELPLVPSGEYAAKKPVHMTMPPDGKTYVVGEEFRFPDPFPEKLMFYGYVRYRDIFNDVYRSGFINRVVKKSVFSYAAPAAEKYDAYRQTHKET